MTMYLTRPGGGLVSSQLPLQVDDVTQSSDRTAITAEAVTFNSAAAAGSTGVNALDKGPILNLTGDKVGSYWGQTQNKVMEFTNRPGTLIGALTETATAATAVITDDTNVLDKLFETATGSRRYILKATDAGGNVLYGWIGDITVSGKVYTFPVHNAVTGGAQSWVGSLSSFDNATVGRISIYSYQSSFVFGTGTVLTEEVDFKEELVQTEYGLKLYLDQLTNGQYGVNYRTGSFYFKKTTTGTTDTVSYTHPGGGGGGASILDDSAFSIGGDFVSPSGFLADETGTDSVDEGDIGIARMTLDRKQINASEFQEDTVFANASYVTLAGVEIDDPTALAAMTEGDVGNLKGDLSGRLIVTDGTLRAGEDLTNNVQRVEGQFSYTATMAADTQVKASAGFLHALTFACNDAAPTAGTIIVYDNTAESGTVVFNHTFTTTPFVPFTIILDVSMGTGIYIGFTTTADVNVTPSWR